MSSKKCNGMERCSHPTVIQLHFVNKIYNFNIRTILSLNVKFKSVFRSTVVAKNKSACVNLLRFLYNLIVKLNTLRSWTCEHQHVPSANEVSQSWYHSLSYSKPKQGKTSFYHVTFSLKQYIFNLISNVIKVLLQQKHAKQWSRFQMFLREGMQQSCGCFQQIRRIQIQR